MSDCLDTPRRDRQTAALDLAFAALREIALKRTTMSPSQVAAAVLQHIQALVPEIDR